MIGPLLFFIHFNHAVSGFNCKFCLFVDDLFIFSPVVLESDHFISHLHLQSSNNLLFHTSRSWGLSFSLGKCLRMNFCLQDAPVLLQYFIGEQSILDAENHKVIRVKINSSLKFHLHGRDFK